MGSRIWVVTELYYPEETSTGYYMTRIAEGLVGAFDAHVLCGQPTYFARGVRAPKREVHNGVTIHRCLGTTLDKNVMIFRLLNMLTLGLSILLAALGGFRRGDLVLVVTTPPSMPFLIALASRLRGARFVLLIHDSYPEILVAVKKARPESLVVRVMNRLNRRLYRAAAGIIVVGRDMMELVSRKAAGMPAERISIIPNWAELEQVKPVSREENALLRELGLCDKLVLLYAGNFGHPNDVEGTLRCAELLRRDERFHFLFIGAGVKKRWLEESAARLGLENVTVLPARPRSDQVNFLNACDVTLVSLVKGMWGVSMPSRTYNALASGKPIIAVTEDGSELARVVEEENVGWVVPPHDAEALAAALREAASDPARLAEYGSRARAAALGKYRVDQAVERYLRVLDGVRSA